MGHVVTGGGGPRSGLVGVAHPRRTEALSTPLGISHCRGEWVQGCVGSEGSPSFSHTGTSCMQWGPTREQKGGAGFSPGHTGTQHAGPRTSPLVPRTQSGCCRHGWGQRLCGQHWDASARGLLTGWLRGGEAVVGMGWSAVWTLCVWTASDGQLDAGLDQAGSQQWRCHGNTEGRAESSGQWSRLWGEGP